MVLGARSSCWQKKPSEVAKSSRADAIRCELHKFYKGEIRTSHIIILMNESHHVQPSGQVRLINTRAKRYYLKIKNCQQGDGDLPSVCQSLRSACKNGIRRIPPKKSQQFFFSRFRENFAVPNNLPPTPENSVPTPEMFGALFFGLGLTFGPK